MDFNRNKSEKEINKNGIYLLAIITENVVSKSSIREFKYYFVYQKHRIGIDNVNIYYYNKHKIGDTIIVKILPSNPEESIIIEDEKYKSSFGKQPKFGWKELPNCKWYSYSFWVQRF